MTPGAPRVRFFEYEAREIVKRAGIPVTDYGFATTPHEAREIADGSAARSSSSPRCSPAGG